MTRPIRLYTLFKNNYARERLEMLPLQTTG